MRGPKAGEYVIVKITEIMPYGARCELVEYPGYRGFIHIGEVSTSWVKNIRQHVKEGQMRVAKVLRVNHDRKMCDLSLKRVSGAIEKRKLEEVRRKKRAKGLLSVAEKIAGKPPEGLEEKLSEVFGDVLRAFEEAALHGEKALEDVDIPEEWKRAIVQVAQKYIEVPKKTVRAEMEIVVPGPRGAAVIRDVLTRAREIASKTEHTEARIYTQGAPVYVVDVTSYDYKTAERVLSSICTFVEDEIRKAGGTFSCRRVEV